MTHCLPDLNLSPREPLFQEIARHLRSAIFNGDLPTGAKLPAVQDIARQYQTSVFTIHSSLTCLAKEGLITRKQRQGTFVCHRRPVQATIGVYFGAAFWKGNEMAFYRELCQELGDGLKAKRLGFRLWTDTRNEEHQNSALPELIQAIRSNELQGLIIAGTNPKGMQWLEKLGIPFSLLGSAPVHSRVSLDYTQMLDRSMQEFKRMGCRSIGAILPFCVRGTAESDIAEEHIRFFQDFTNIAEDTGLKTRNSWIRTPATNIHGQAHEQFGYSEFHQIWNQPKRPDGLFVFPDTIVRGCLTAILEAGIRAPSELKLVLHRSINIPLICPLPASWVVTDVKLIASELISQLEQVMSGQEVQVRKVPVSFESAEPSPS